MFLKGGHYFDFLCIYLNVYKCPPLICCFDYQSFLAALLSFCLNKLNIKNSQNVKPFIFNVFEFHISFRFPRYVVSK